MNVKHIQWYLDKSCNLNDLITSNDYDRLVKSCSTVELKQVKKLAEMQQNKDFLLVINEELKKR